MRCASEDKTQNHIVEFSIYISDSRECRQILSQNSLKPIN